MKRFYFLLIPALCFAGCRQIQSLAKTVESNTTATSGGADNAEYSATPSAQTLAECKKRIGGLNGDKPGSKGQIPAEFPAPPRGSILCGESFTGDVVYLNTLLGTEEIAQYYRDALTDKGFTIQKDNPQMNGRFLAYGRGASEGGYIEVGAKRSGEILSFSVNYAPPFDSSSDNTTTTPTTDSASRNATPDASGGDCGRYQIGSYECAAQLQMNLKSWQFSIEEKDRGGRIKSFKGERALPGNNRVVIHVTISGASRKDDGEWWYRLGSVAGQSDNGFRVYYKEATGWTRIESPPDDVGDLVSMTNVVSPLLASSQAAVGEETINGQNCNHFRRTDSESGVVTDTWISRSTGYAVRVFSKDRSENTRQSDFSRQNEPLSIETPRGAE